MSIIVPIIVWNMAEQLEACIKAAREVLPDPYVIVVDGVYAKFPHDALKPWSTDGTLDVARALADTVVEISEPWESEIAKRNSYLIGDPGDLYVHLDADEILRGVWPAPNNQDFNLEFRRHEPRRAYLYRVFPHRKDLHYRYKHNYLWSNEVLLNSLPRDVLPGVHVFHTIDSRPETAFAKGAYRRHLANIESKFYHLDKGVVVKESKVTQAEKTETIVFLAGTRSAYHGKFEVTKPGQTVKVTPTEAERLCRTFPKDFEVVPKDGPIRAPGIPAPEKLNLTSPVFRNIKYLGTALTVVAGKTVNPGDVIRVTQQLAAVLVKTKKWEPAGQEAVQTHREAFKVDTTVTTSVSPSTTVMRIEPLKLPSTKDTSVQTVTARFPTGPLRVPVARK
ncbi:MAG: hypothetical protein UY48_C0003G0005 [Candidatus Gottesmanbacteria bacterium GW2011_GWB1_49_7]|uniref:Uncharacterized protein n=1 Tax=Candidatus Gottesmanbacteria bacterium GW2011_GWB1_49_7 TaxID=1618448 RepID=A0A0G1W3B7_9BACT|nr:MAG: hypothetical protein UY48_C0003G0005 [Candidatus Gottesmanbacteria bacterium GW2011_GWB1_49_7]